VSRQQPKPTFRRPTQANLRRVADVLARVSFHPSFDHRHTTLFEEQARSFVGPPSPVPSSWALGVIQAILFPGDPL